MERILNTFPSYSKMLDPFSDQVFQNTHLWIEKMPGYFSFSFVFRNTNLSLNSQLKWPRNSYWSGLRGALQYCRKCPLGLYDSCKQQSKTLLIIFGILIVALPAFFFNLYRNVCLSCKWKLWGMKRKRWGDPIHFDLLLTLMRTINKHGGTSSCSPRQNFSGLVCHTLALQSGFLPPAGRLTSCIKLA